MVRVMCSIVALLFITGCLASWNDAVLYSIDIQSLLINVAISVEDANSSMYEYEESRQHRE